MLASVLPMEGLGEVASLDPRQFLGIPLALLGAALLAFGAQYQSRGLNKVERIVGASAGSGLSLRHVLGLLRRPSWVSGTLLLGLAVAFQIGSLALSPIIIVQPIGVVGLVITSILMVGQYYLEKHFAKGVGQRPDVMKPSLETGAITVAGDDERGYPTYPGAGGDTILPPHNRPGGGA